ncbi:hypothetical protein GCM10028807_60680 [Spirosoma daeguense]
MFRPNLESEARSMTNRAMSDVRSGLMRSKSIRNTILFVIITFFIFAGVGYVGHLIANKVLPIDSDVSFWTYAIILSIVFILGMVNVSALRSYMPWIQPDDYLQGGLMTLLMGIIGGVAIFLISFSPRLFQILADQEFRANVRPLVSTVLIFPLPFLIQWAYENYDAIPPKVFKKWKYNPFLQMPALTESEFKRTTSVIFVLDIKYGERNSYDIRSFIPDVMNVGDGFQFSIDEHNEDEPSRRIEVRSSPKDFFEWHFYVQRPWYRKNLYIDPDRTCRENHLLNGVRILAHRLAPRPSKK